MKRYVWLPSLMGFSFTSLAGTLLHFLYEWLGEAVWIAPFSGVNESTWEHMKLLFWPMLLFAVIGSFFSLDKDRFFSVKLRGILLGLSLIPTLFYLYNGVIGKSPDFVNISIFFIAAAAAFIYEMRIFNSEKGCTVSRKLSFSVLALIALAFVIFTFRTPHLAIFRDPLTGRYGIG